MILSHSILQDFDWYFKSYLGGFCDFSLAQNQNLFLLKANDLQAG